ncbi:MAG: NTP transferase domain-containing protein [Bacteroidetes bacterium]|nr:NTP transferase domain-containing protein [Bacteroidota bacterium]
MRAIIPVAGIGSRLRPHTFTVPKVLLNVAGKPIIGHILDKIVEAGCNEATIVIGYLGDMIKEYVHKNYKIKVDFVEQEERLGLGHAIYISKYTFSDEPILIILGDTIFDVDLKSMIQNKQTQIGVKPVEDPRRFGVAEVNNGWITKLVEKPEIPKSNLAIVGLYYITNPKILVSSLEKMIQNNIQTKNEYQLTDALQIMIEQKEKIGAFPVEGWFDCGKPETLLSTNRYLLERQPVPQPMEGVLIKAPSFISPKAKVVNSIVGPNATIAEEAVVENTIVRNSIISEGAAVLNSLIEDSIIGSNAVIRGNYKRINIGDSSELEYY